MIVQEVQEVELGEVEEEGQALLGNLSGLESLSFVRFLSLRGTDEGKLSEASRCARLGPHSARL